MDKPTTDDAGDGVNEKAVGAGRKRKPRVGGRIARGASGRQRATKAISPDNVSGTTEDDDADGGGGKDTRARHSAGKEKPSPIERCNKRTRAVKRRGRNGAADVDGSESAPRPKRKRTSNVRRSQVDNSDGGTASATDTASTVAPNVGQSGLAVATRVDTFDDRTLARSNPVGALACAGDQDDENAEASEGGRRQVPTCQPVGDAVAAPQSAAARRRERERAIGLKRLYGDPSYPERKEIMHVATGHALLKRDDVFYMHPLSERCLVQAGTVPCPEPKRAVTYHSSLDITPSGPCMHCDRMCTRGRVPIPRAYDPRTGAYAVWGNFCWFPCAIAYQLEHGAGLYETPYVIMLIQKMAFELWNLTELQRPAPPRMCFMRYGGDVDPEDIERICITQTRALIETPFITWAMMVEARSIADVTHGSKCFMDQHAPRDPHRPMGPAVGPCSKSTPQTPTDPTLADPPPPDGSVIMGLSDSVDHVSHETADAAMERVTRSWHLRGLPEHDPAIEHPGTLSREGGVVGIGSSSGHHGTVRKHRLLHGRPHPSSSFPDQPFDSPVGGVVRGDASVNSTSEATSPQHDLHHASMPPDVISSTSSESLWNKFMRQRADANNTL